MLEEKIRWVKEWGPLLIIGLLSFWFFEGMIRPVLIDFHPMFAERYELGGYSTPAGVGYFLTYGISYIIYIIFEAFVESYQSNQDEEGF